MAGEEFQIVVRKSLAEVEKELRGRFHIEGNPLDSSFIEDGSLVLVFGQRGGKGLAATPGTPVPRSERSRRKARRNRTRTRGWKPLTSFVNSLGQRVRVYDVFVNALRGQQLGKVEQRKIVDSLLRANGNEPTREQVAYFLDNTQEYLSQDTQKKAQQ